MKEEKKLPSIKIGGREIPLFYSSLELVDIQKEIGCTSFQLNEEVFGVHMEDEDDPKSIRFGVMTDGEKLERFGKLVRILGNAGLEEDGKEPDLTDKAVLRAMKPSLLLAYGLAVMAVVNDAQMSEAAAEEQEESGPVDELVEEENRKKAPGK